ncbi:MAG: hypothetical protein PHS38_10775 [Bacteroidales bacterium]|jgi:hypothetical protein|nr:hypothetical protein [Bacteroidales bacterium]
MPTNLLKVYNQLLELNSLNEAQRRASLKGIFNRDIVHNPDFSFRKKKINPTPAEGQDTMERLFTHLTTVITDKVTRHREYENARSVRLHWLKHHIEEQKAENIIFSVEEPEGIRTYIYDRDEEYVIVLEPMRNGEEYYLLSAYHIEGKDKARNKMAQKHKRRLRYLL